VFNPAGELVYVSAACGGWLQVDPEALLAASRRDRGAKGGSLALDESPSAGHHEALVQALSPPPGLTERRQLLHRIELPPRPAAATADAASLRAEDASIACFLALDGPDGLFVLATRGPFVSGPISTDIQTGLLIRETLDRWRAAQPGLLEYPLTLGSSRRAERLRAQLRLAAATEAHVGLIGPAGSGSRSIAAAIHRQAAQRWDRETARLVTVEGALMDPELLDASLGPTTDWLSRSETHRASLLVTEIDEMPAAAQLRLDQWIERFAPRFRLLALSRRPIAASATSEPAAGEANRAPAGAEASLAEKLELLSVDVPPLRERAEDIPLIAAALLQRRRSGGEGRADQFSRAATDALVTYPWPADYDELDAAVRQAIRGCPGSTIQAEHLPLSIRSYRPGDPQEQARRMPIDLDRTLRNVERRLIDQALQQAGDNRAEAARRLNISRARLLRRLKELEDTTEQQAREE